MLSLAREGRTRPAVGRGLIARAIEWAGAASALGGCS
jgi:hypothetical protein